MRLSGKRVWITGASAGIGAALARHAAELGADLTLSARSADKLEAVGDSLATGTDWESLRLDLTRPEDFAAAVAHVGPVDYLINNGGISQRATALDTEPRVVRRVMEVNYFGQVELTRLVLPGMIARRTGHIAVTSSVAGKIGTPLRSAYAASKHALHGFFDSLRYEVEPHGLRVTMLCPGYIHTDISRNAVTGDGTPQGTMDAHQAAGMSPGEFASRAWHAILAGREEVYIGGKELAGVYLGRYAPGILRRVLRKRDWDNAPAPGEGQ